MNETVHFDHVFLKPVEQIGMHKQPTWELSFVVTGSGVRTIGGVSEPFSEGDIVLLPPEVPHCWQFSAAYASIENITVIFSDDFIRSASSAYPEFDGAFSAMKGWTEAVRFTGKTQQFMAEGLRRMSSCSAAGRVACLLSLLVVMAESTEQEAVGGIDKQSSVQYRLKRIEIFIDCNYKRNVSIADIANHVGMNRSALCVFFRRHTGKTLLERINERRLAVACHLLRRSSLTVQQICFESGYKDYPHFCRMFKRQMGVTPKMFRKKETPQKAISDEF